MAAQVDHRPADLVPVTAYELAVLGVAHATAEGEAGTGEVATEADVDSHIGVVCVHCRNNTEAQTFVMPCTCYTKNHARAYVNA